MNRRYVLLDVQTPDGKQETDLYFVSYETWQSLTAYLAGVDPLDAEIASQLQDVAITCGSKDRVLTDRQRIASHWMHLHAQKADVPRWPCPLP